MSLLNLKKKTTKTTEVTTKVTPKNLSVVEGSKKNATGNIRPQILRHPHVTEKAAASAERGIYVFEVATDANKRDIAKAVELFYKVTPVKVTVVTIPAKIIMVKGRKGVRKAGKKAYVFLKKGEKIEIN